MVIYGYGFTMPMLNHILITAVLFGATSQVETSIKYLNYKDVLAN